MTSEPDAGMQAVACTVLGLELQRGSGSLIALVSVKLDVAGVVIVLQGVRVLRSPLGGIEVNGPQYRAGDGRWHSAVMLPEALQDALGAAVLAALPSYGVRP